MGESVPHWDEKTRSGLHSVIWLKNGRIIGQDSSTSDDGRVHVYHSSERYYLRITNARPEDAGEYKVTLDGTGIGATITVVVTGTITPHVVVCPPGNKACKSGHCLSSSLFCDGHRHCPDGDDEIGCHGMKCASHQIRCAIDDTCVPKSVACDGVKNCKDGTDELNCTVLTKPTTRSFYSHASRSTVLCPDGSTPEYSL
ncbi:unnamed protein product [Toxocara canis]|uniref:I-set domain-containing protein n=1 Tax=Toxocara canis TaxID=6265 RepID=A0A183U1A7_TOXCA|nr:unnamed protein product [Toxocara canis]